MKTAKRKLKNGDTDAEKAEDGHHQTLPKALTQVLHRGLTILKLVQKDNSQLLTVFSMIIQIGPVT